MAEVTDVDITAGIPTGGTGTVPTLSKTNTLAGAVNETAPATDTASSGLNGRLQRIAQRLTTALTGIVLAAGTNLIGKVKTKFIRAASAATTRPANQTPYTAGDAVSNNATAGSVTAFSFSLSDVNDDLFTIERLTMVTTDTGVRSKSFRVWLFNVAPTITGGDNTAFDVAATGFIGTMSGTFRTTTSGAAGVFVPDEGARIIASPVSGAKTVLGLMQALDDFTPSANSTTFTPTIEGFQGAA